MPKGPQGQKRPADVIGAAVMVRRIVLAFLLIACPFGANAEVVSLQFYKDDCQKFLQSKSDDQEMYLMWATGRISRELRKDPKTAGTLVDSAKTSQWLRDYCAAHPTTGFAEAADAAKTQIAGARNP
jgi:hypothetical protein